VVAGVLASAAPALAKDYRHNGSECELTYASDVSSQILQGGEVANDSTTDAMELTCPVHSSDYLRQQSINTANVHGYSGQAQSQDTTKWALAQACVKFYGSFGGNCGTLVAKNGSGFFTLQPGLTAWKTYTADFAYYTVRLPSKVGGTRSALYGVWLSE